MPADPQRIQSIFLAAIEAADPADRAALLARECGDDAELRQRVEVLLQAHDRSGSFLDKPAVEPVTTDAPAGQWIDRDAPLPLTERPGMRVGRYKLLQQIGEGGMGIVYMAEQQEPVRRMVALKIIKPGMDSEAVVARFEAERQALALMDHQNIARVFDGGTTDSGRPFFVMELVKGIPITRFCDENRLTPRERLQLFVSVCEAVQHAHQKGVIHRDLKPSNVLVTLYDGKPVPKVIDFGVAKALHQRLTERTMFTAFGTVVGTLEYMSPEQAEMNALDVDTRSDVYSLGVLLYELLTGTTPLERERLRKAVYTEMLRLIREEEPQRPSMRISGSGQALARISSQRKTEPAQLARLVRGELDWIVMKALEKDRGRRYETATGLARDVERYLKDEPVEACPPSVGYRLGKMLRRNKGSLLAASLVMLALIVGMVGTTLGMLHAHRRSIEAERAELEANDKRDEADNERNRADSEAAHAKANAEEARKLLDRLSVEQGLRLAENDDLFTALLWFAKPLERGGLSPEDERIHRMRFACYLRHTHGRPVLRQMLFHDSKVRKIAFSPDATLLLTSTEKGNQVWDLNSDRELAKLERSQDFEQFRFLDARRVFGQVGSKTQTWDAATGSLLGSQVMESEPIARSFLLAMPHTPWQALGAIAVWESHNWSAKLTSPDGRLHLHLLATRAWVCEAATGKMLHRWSSPTLDESFIHADFSADGHRILLATSRRARVYDGKTGAAIGPMLVPQSEVSRAAINVDGSRVLLVSLQNLAIWDAIAGKQVSIAVSGFDFVSAAPAMSPDGRILALSEGFGFSQDGRFALWNGEEGRLITVHANQRSPHSVKFSPDSCNIISAGKDRADVLWDARGDRAAAPLLPNLGLEAVYEFSPDGSMVAVAHGDGIVRVWHLAGYWNAIHETGLPMDKLPQAIASWSCVIHSPISSLTTGYGPLFHKRLSELREFLKVLSPSVQDKDVFAAISPDGNRLVTVEVEREGLQMNSMAQLWDTAAGGPLGQPIAHLASLTHVEFSSDSRLLVTTSNPGTARLFDARTGRPLGRPMQHGDGVRHANLSADGSRLVTCGSDGTVQIWDTVTSKPIYDRLRHADDVNAAVFSPDGQHVATASSDGTARLWDAATGHPIGQALVEGCPLFHIAFDSRGRLLLTQGLNVLLRAEGGWPNPHRIWDAATQQAVSPNLYIYPAFKNGSSIGAKWDTQYLFFPIGQMGMKYDLSQDPRRTEDLVKLSQLHTGQRLNDQGSLTPLSRSELQKLWKELRLKYPEEFSVRPEAIRFWHLERIKILEVSSKVSKQATVAAIQLHREWLKKLNTNQP